MALYNDKEWRDCYLTVIYTSGKSKLFEDHYIINMAMKNTEEKHAKIEKLCSTETGRGSPVIGIKQDK